MSFISRSFKNNIPPTFLISYINTYSYILVMTSISPKVNKKS